MDILQLSQLFFFFVEIGLKSFDRLSVEPKTNKNQSNIIFLNDGMTYCVDELESVADDFECFDLRDVVLVIALLKQYQCQTEKQTE